MDGDGEITTEELRAAMTKLMGEHMSSREIDSIVKEADDNGDGTVDFEGTNIRFFFICSDIKHQECLHQQFSRVSSAYSTYFM